MDKKIIEKYCEELQNKTPTEVIKWAADTFGANNDALASSLSIEDQVITDIIAKSKSGIRIFTLDTGRLPQETYNVIEETIKKYGINYEILFPETKFVEDMLQECGPNLFYKSVENRKKCCNIRKIEPLRRVLSGLKCWISGLRSRQSVTRTDMQIIEWDSTFDLLKINPLIEWSEEEVWQYIRDKKVPYNKLYDEGYRSIGCAPCTMAVKPGEEIRAGRWWWESPEQRECGLHIKNGKVVRDE